MLNFHRQLSKEDLERAQEFSEQIEDLVRNKTFEYVLAETLLGENAIPEYIMEIRNDIRTTTLPKEDLVTFWESAEDGPSLISGVLNIGQNQAKKFLKDPKTASVLLRSLRDKLEEMEYKKERAKAEEHGFIATVIFTIKRAIHWIIKKFNDLRDDFLDMMMERPAHSSQTKRDYNYIMNKQRDYFINNTDWYLNSEH